MRVKAKVFVTFGFVGFVVAAVSLFAVRALSSSSSSLNYIVGAAWNTADGAMETSIEIEAQMLAVKNLIIGADLAAVEKDLNNAIEGANEASSRMIEAGLLGEQRAQQFTQLNRQYQTQRNALIDVFHQFHAAKKEYDQATTQLVEFGEKYEALGDHAVEALAQEPDRLLTWREDVQTRWQAADGGMESNIGLLWKLYQIQRLIDGEDDQTQLAKIEQAARFQKEANEAMFSTGLFDVPVGDEWGTQTYTEVFQQLNRQHEKATAAVIEAYRQYRAQFAQYNATSQTFLNFIAEMEAYADSMVEQQAIETLKESAVAASVFKAVILGALGMVVILGWVLCRQILSPVERLIERMNDISDGNGDLTRRVGIASQDEFGQLGSSVDKFIAKVQVLVDEINQSIATVRGAAADLSQTFHQTTGSVKAQTIEVKAIASATEEMANNSTQVASSAREVDQSVASIDNDTQNTLNSVREASLAVSELVTEVARGTETINALKNHVTNIEPILVDINGIAEQTNLLALNAAIEAARAGDQGRGFAVVADEVRSLAIRTQDSTSMIQESMLKLRQSADESVRVMNEGMAKGSQTTHIAELAEESLHRVALEINRLTEMNQQTVSAISEQERVANEVVSSVSNLQELCDGTHQNIHQSESTIYALLAKQEELALKVSKFKVS
ncbi:methyl-accepting chemotaxis protein [Photobacterium galatheae]|uniref:Chemotaxis protein n=1 Tax=Photobacterium galatheae TaxID=1654360 RepID=A0A066RIX6_9GAMM|nr:methyl-accepting chemotaxis protein [Photobacterium galatheae]KDM90269.1 chemotaxis protein [Photobacterium galatheae]MCM0151469.1 methyl-accepting chemotaxis protein [Photobacterium galatheae]